MFTRFFIDRPIFATVLSIIITLSGAVGISSLPVAQYPEITPPTVEVSTVYPGANSRVVADTVAAPIEQQVNGVEDMMYMSSQCTNDGTYTLTVTFKIGTDLNMSQIRVLNRVSLAYPQLPEVVRATGVTTRKRSSEILMTVALSSPDRRYDQLYLSNYAVIRLREELSRLPGVSDVLVFGQRDYAMRVWVDPEKLAARDLTAGDVVAAVREQNTPLVAGQVGLPPVASGQLYQFPITGVGRLTNVEDFEQVVVKVGPAGQKVLVKDVARVELGAKAQDVSNTFDNKPTVGLAVFLLADANALEARDRIKDKMDEMSKDFPEGIDYEIGYDTTPFIRESIREVFTSLWESIALVSVVVLIFLQSWRAAIIPLAAVPVAIVGTFAVMAGAGFSLNNLTLFGLVLAVGIVVDDAIVVVEAVQHHLEKGLAPREATVRAMEDVAGPVVAVGVVLSAVFVPCAFLSGIVGQFFRQFALTIAVSTLISTFNSLTLSPALCAILLKPQHARPDIPTRVLNLLFGWLFKAFNWGFARSGGVYVRLISLMFRVPALVLAGYAGMLAAGVVGYGYLPTGFIPQQDKGYLIASIQLPDAASADRTRQAIAKIASAALDYRVPVDAREGEDGAEWLVERFRPDGSKAGPKDAAPDAQERGRWVRWVHPVKHVNSVAGNSFVLSAYGSNFGSMFIILDGFENRQAPNLYADVVRAELSARLAAAVPEAQVNVFGAPAVSGLGRAGGFRFMVEDRGDLGPDVLQAQTDSFIEKSRKLPQVTGLFTVYKTNSPPIFADIDRAACLSKRVDLADVNTVLQASMGSRYVNDFNRFGRTWQVNVQADPQFRSSVPDILQLQVRNAQGQMIRMGTVMSVRDTSGPVVVMRYNMYSAAAITGNPVPGTGSGEAIALMRQIAERELPRGMKYEWTELAYLQNQAGNTAMWFFALAVVFVFLVLAAQYESWKLPLAVILVVPMCLLCSIVGVLVAGIEVTVFTQIGFVVLVGLACKNAILIVEFARQKQEDGRSRREATVEAAQLRLRPIVMTSFAFIFGVVPLVYAQGAGAEMRQSLGVAVFSGMLGVTAFGIFLTPVFYYVLQWFGRTGMPAPSQPLDHAAPTRHLDGSTRVDVPFEKGEHAGNVNGMGKVEPAGTSEIAH